MERSFLEMGSIVPGTLAGWFVQTLLFPKAAYAVEAAAAIPQADMGSATIRMLGALLLVVVIILGLYYLAKRLRWGRLSFNKYPEMRMIGSLNLAPRRSVAMVEVCGQWLVLGVGAETVTLLWKLEQPPVGESSGATDSGQSNGFQTLLRQKILRKPPLQREMGEGNEKST